MNVVRGLMRVVPFCEPEFRPDRWQVSGDMGEVISDNLPGLRAQEISVCGVPPTILPLVRILLRHHGYIMKVRGTRGPVMVLKTELRGSENTGSKDWAFASRRALRITWVSLGDLLMCI